MKLVYAEVFLNLGTTYVNLGRIAGAECAYRPAPSRRRR
jgi:hypothetical protein